MSNTPKLRTEHDLGKRPLRAEELEHVSGGYIFADVVESWSWGSANVGGYKAAQAEGLGN